MYHLLDEELQWIQTGYDVTPAFQELIMEQKHPTSTQIPEIVSLFGAQLTACTRLPKAASSPAALVGPHPEPSYLDALLLSCT